MKRVLAVFGLLLALTSAAIAQRPDPTNTPVITVRGEGQVRVAPDEATVRIGIMKQAPTAQVAQEQVNTLANGILAALTKNGIPSNQVQTSRLTLSAVYAPRGNDMNATPRIIAYQAANIVTVRLFDLTKV